MSLKQLLLNDQVRGNVVDSCVELIDQEVDNKGGLTGLAVKGAYMIVKKIKSGFVREVVDHLVDEFVEKLEPFYTEAQRDKRGLADNMLARPAEIANALLGVTDGRAERAKNGTLKKAYDKLRPSAQKHVEAAVPALARLVSRYAGETREKAV